MHAEYEVVQQQQKCVPAAIMSVRVVTRRTMVHKFRTLPTYRGGKKFRHSGLIGRLATHRRRRGIGVEILTR